MPFHSISRQPNPKGNENPERRFQKAEVDEANGNEWMERMDAGSESLSNGSTEAADEGKRNETADE